MQALELLNTFIGPLETNKIKYLVTGSVASTIYGEPRMTHDLDLVLHLPLKQAERIQQAFPDKDFYCAPLEVVRLEIRRPQRGHFNILHHAGGYRADIYLMGTDQLSRWAMQNRRRLEVVSMKFWLAPPEYVIMRKLEYYREGNTDKHLQDIRAMLAISGDEIDLQLVQELVKEGELRREWELVQT